MLSLAAGGLFYYRQKMPERGFSSMLFMQLIIAVSSLAYIEGKKRLSRLMVILPLGHGEGALVTCHKSLEPGENSLVWAIEIV